MIRTPDLGVMSPARSPLRHTGEGLLQCLDAPLRCDDKYRQSVSIGRPRSYEPRALPLRYAGEVVCDPSTSIGVVVGVD